MIVLNRFLVSTDSPFESSLKNTELKEAEIATARKIIFISWLRKDLTREIFK